MEFLRRNQNKISDIKKLTEVENTFDRLTGTELRKDSLSFRVSQYKLPKLKNRV